MRRHALVAVLAAGGGIGLVGLQATPVAAECPYLPPWPPITLAIPTAREIVVGQVVTDFRLEDLNLGPNQGPRDHALRIIEVLRGPAHPGAIADIQYLLPNWPQTAYAGGTGPTPSCRYLGARPGETIALAIGALQPGGTITEEGTGREWTLPPTRYNAVGVIDAGPDGDREREVVTIGQLRALAGLPPTDAVREPVGPPTGTIALLAGIAAAAMLLSLRATRAARRR